MLFLPQITLYPGLMLLLLVAGFAQEQPQPTQDLSLLVGKRVMVQRMPLCQPRTYNVVLAYAGKQASAISVKASRIPHVSQATLRKMPPAGSAMLENAYRAATILVRFEDGTQLDTCAPIGPSRLPDYLELAPGQDLQTAAQQASGTPLSSPRSSLVSPLASPTDVLSEEDVRLAVKGKGRDHWTRIKDMGLMAAQGNQVPSIDLYMPEAVLALRAESAKKQFLRYEPAEEDKSRSLTVVANGYAGRTIADGCTSITRVALVSDSSGRIVEEAYSSEPLEEIWRNSFGATDRCQALRTKFSLDKVYRVRVAAQDGEFFVAVFFRNREHENVQGQAEAPVHTQTSVSVCPLR